VAGLEERLGTRLLNRTTRSLSLTEAGSLFLDRAKRILADLDAAESLATGDKAAPAGHLTLTAPLTFGRMHVTPALLEFLRAEPKVTASLTLLDRIVSLTEEGIDAAIRIGSLPDSSLVARPIGEVQRILVASPAYLAKRGAPATPLELRQHDILAFPGANPAREWRFRDGKRAKAVAIAPRLEVNDAAAAIAGAVLGEGITMAFTYMVAPLLAEGKLKLVLDGRALPPVPVQIVYQESRLMPAKLRAFIDFAAPRLGHALAEVGVQLALARRR
jgi:DNA-binding transcriptional LysR family regulator